MPDISHRFIFPDTDVRGSLVRLQDSVSGVVSQHDYPMQIRSLLGEFLAAAVLLSETLKYEGRLTLQVRGSGPVSLLMAEATHDLHIRGIARLGDKPVSATDFAGLFGKASLVVTVEPQGLEPYQSLVPLLGDSLSESLTHYFEQSEQLATRIYLASDAKGAAGMLLQQLPPQLVTDAVQRANHWQHIQVLGGTITPEELLNLDHRSILNRLFVEDDVSLLADRPVAFLCSCSAERFANAVVSLGDAELDDLFAETPTLDIHCEFCGEHYAFDRDRLMQLVAGDEILH